MKKLLQYVVQIESQAALIFTGITMVVSLIYGAVLHWPITWQFLWQLVVLSFLCAGVQFVFFSGVVFKKMSYPKRLLSSLPAFLVLMTLTAVIFRWFPLNQWHSWLIFLGIFALVFLGCTVGFEIYFRVSGQKYDDMLAQYKAKTEEK